MVYIVQIYIKRSNGMEKTKHSKSVFAQVFSIFKSKRIRNLFYLLIIALATLSMFFIDKDNTIRDKYLSFLNNNVLADILAGIGIRRYNVTSSAWVWFIVIASVAFVFVLGNIIAPGFVNKKVKENPNLFSTEKKTRAWYNTLFYVVLILIAAALVGIFALLGFFKYYGENNAPVFNSLWKMLVVILILIVAVFIAVTVILFIVRLIVLACTHKLNKAEEETTEEPVAESAEEPVVETAEPVTEEPAAEPVAEQKETPVIINDIQETDATVATAATENASATRKSIQKSFAGKMAQATKEQKAYYNELKNYMLSFKRVNSRVSWNYDSFNIGRKKAVKIAFRGQTMCVFFALNPKDYQNTKYYPRDMGSKRKFADTPMMIKVKSSRGVKFAKELMNEVCAELDAKKNFTPAKYDFPYMSDRKLVENGLAKEITVTVFAFKK